MDTIRKQTGPGSELRRTPRLRVAAPFACAFSRLGLQRWLSPERSGLGVVLDVSLGGAKVMSPAAIAPGDHLAMSLRLPDQVAAMNVEAIVRWGKDHTFGMEFTAVSQSAASRLKKFLSRSPIAVS
ncbi:MAG TPA: PilZ domain-containing protein [Nitrospira sp.]|nr:PilZ domain-containing protein [Nitrospira sp.]